MDVRSLRQVGRIDLHDRADDHDRPFGMGVGERSEKLEVHPLVDHSVESEARRSDAGMIVRLAVDGAGPAEMVAVDARREGMDVRVPVLLRLVEAVATGEDDVGAGQKLALETEKLRRRET